MSKQHTEIMSLISADFASMVSKACLRSFSEDMQSAQTNC